MTARAYRLLVKEAQSLARAGGGPNLEKIILEIELIKISDGDFPKDFFRGEVGGVLKGNRISCTHLVSVFSLYSRSSDPLKEVPELQRLISELASK